MSAIIIKDTPVVRDYTCKKENCFCCYELARINYTSVIEVGFRDMFLITNFNKMSYKELGGSLKRGKKALWKRAKELGLGKKLRIVK